MKLKHWQGYGSVDATKIRKTVQRGIVTLIVKVKGNHECGLRRDDHYDLANWLIKRFDKTFKDYRSIQNVSIRETEENGVDVCVYTFTYDTP